MEHSYEAYRAKAEELLRDTVCTVGLGAKKLTDAAKRQLEIADLHAEVNTCLRELGELLYATHTGTLTESEVLLAKLQEIDGLRQQIDRLEREIARLQGGAVCPFCGAAARSGDVFCRECGQKL